jgi:hypothetical protein
VGNVTSANAPKLGYEMTITVRKENGDPVTATGVVEEILEKNVPWWRQAHPASGREEFQT